MNRPTIRGLSRPLEIGSIYCIGRNYVEHVRELNHEVPDEPLVFLKPASAVIHDGGSVVLPGKSREVHHEIELVAAIGKEANGISREKALDYVAGYGIGIDVTARDLQAKAKRAGTPWTVAKGFDTFAPLSDFIPADRIADPQQLDLELRVNGKIRQKGGTDLMIFPVDELISYLSGIFTLYPGDLLFTGTPAGVSPIEAGDRLTGSMGDDLASLSVNVTRES